MEQLPVIKIAKQIIAIPLLLSLCFTMHAQSRHYQVGLIDLMLLKRQKLGALPLAKQLGADGLEIDMGGLGDRPTFDNQLLVDSIRQQFLDKAKELDLQIISLSITGYYAQSF